MNDELKIKNNKLGEKMKYRYRTDEEMKDSGIEWVGTIPKAWNLSKFKFISELYTGNSIKDNEKDNYQDSNEAYPYIATKDIDMNYNKADYFNGMYTKINDINFRIAKKNSILLCIEGGSAGKKITYLNRNVSFVNKLCCINPSNINNKYQYYYCNSNSFLKEFNLNISGLIGGVSVGVLKNFIITKPNIVEQEKISKFLDKKTAQFDSIISKKEALIEKLEEAKKSLISEVVTGKVRVVKTNDGYELVERKKEEMKDSGVEWLGDIPKEWDVKRLRFLGSLQNGISKSSDEFGFGYPFVSYGDVYKNIELPKEVKGLVNSSIQDRKIYSVEEGDVLFTRTSETVEEIGFASTCLEEIKDATFAGFLIRFRPNSNRLFKGFSKYYFRCDLNRKFFVKEMNLVTRASLSQNLLNNLSVLLPSYEEQKEIYLALELNVNSINDGISKIRYQIEKLKEAKQSLISEAVTGKIEILD